VFQICHPSGDNCVQMSVYNGHKKYHGFKMQCVYSPDGMIIHYAGPYASRHHDNWVLRDSRLEDMLRADFRLNEATGVQGRPGITHFHLYGDPGMLRGVCLLVLAACAATPRFLISLRCMLLTCMWCRTRVRVAAYNNSEILQAPFWSPLGHDALTDDQKGFNRDMSKVRIPVEWAFKELTSTFPLLRFGALTRVLQQPVGKYYVVTADLVNLKTILRKRNQTSLYFNMMPPSLEEYLAPRQYCVPEDIPIPPMPAYEDMVDDSFREGVYHQEDAEAYQDLQARWDAIFANEGGAVAAV
jgi:hypothetical protein